MTHETTDSSPTDTTSGAAKIWKRVRITGTLTLTSPLMLGDGTTRDGKKNDDGAIPQIGCVARDSNGRAMIPGASLKGVLRSWLNRQNVDTKTIERLFGRESNEKDAAGKSPDSGQGGCIEFGYSYSKKTFTTQDLDRYVEQSVVIDRVTRSASDRLLFAHETVPIGTVFDVELLGFGITDEHIAVLMHALEGFNSKSHSVKLGSGTANDYGRASWKQDSIKAMSANQITKWLENCDQNPNYWDHASQPAALPPVSEIRRSTLRFQIELTFDSWFLIRDPHRSKQKSDDGESDKPNAFPRLNAQGHVIAPPRSFRGVFRSQVERIARTINDNAGGDPVRNTAPGIVEALFGFTGGRTVVQCSEFVDSLPAVSIMVDKETGELKIPDEVTSCQKRPLFPREFVAIDRFTGGAAEHFKFNCVAAWQPVLKGFISIDLADLERRCQQVSLHPKKNPITPAAPLGLLFLTFRDLIEGDVSFGMGAAKGFGQCHAKVQVSIASGCPAEVNKLLTGQTRNDTSDDKAKIVVDVFEHPWFTPLVASCIEAACNWLNPKQEPDHE